MNTWESLVLPEDPRPQDNRQGPQAAPGSRGLA